MERMFEQAGRWARIPEASTDIAIVTHGGPLYHPHGPLCMAMECGEGIVVDRPRLGITNCMSGLGGVG